MAILNALYTNRFEICDKFCEARHEANNFYIECNIPIKVIIVFQSLEICNHLCRIRVVVLESDQLLIQNCFSKRCGGSDDMLLHRRIVVIVIGKQSKTI